MKRKSLILALLLCVFAGSMLTACGGGECTHENREQTATTATCLKGGTVTYSCPDCGETWTEEVGALGHDYVTKAEESSAATCTENGRTVTVCSRCNDRQENYIQAAGHKWEGTDCTGKECSVCHETLPATVAHAYKRTKTTAATCTEDGEDEYTCSLCGDTYTVTTAAATGHNYQIAGESGKYTLKDANNCTYTSSHTLKCTVCNDEKTEEYEIQRHDYVTKITREATCQTAGERSTVCSVCNAVKPDSTKEFEDENAHKWNSGVKAGNVTTYTCTVSGCSAEKKSIEADAGAKDVQVTKEALQSVDEVVVGGAAIAMDEKAKESLADSSFTMGVDVADKASDIDASLQGKLANDVYNITLSDGNSNITNFGDGKVTVRIPYTLQEGEDVNAIVIWYVNGKELTNVTATYSNGYVTFETEHFSYYTVGKYTPEEMCEKYGHYEVTRSREATCTESGYIISVCTRCGANIKTEYTPATGHNFTVDETASKAATCTAAGERVQKCSNCNVTIKETLPATGHEWQLKNKQEATCEKAGSEQYECGICDASYTITIPQRMHDFREAVTQPTCTEEGYTTYTCRFCNYSYTGEKIPARGHSWNPEVPTCGQGQVCTVCGAKGLPATGEHNFKDGVCTVCGEGCDHDWTAKEDVPSTCVDYGYTLFECSKCGTTKKDDFKQEYGPHTFKDGVCTVCGTKSEAAEAFYTTFFKSLKADKYALSIGDGTKFTMTRTYYGENAVETVGFKMMKASVNITEDGKLLFSFDFQEEYSSYRGEAPQQPMDVMEAHFIFDGETLYGRMINADGTEEYIKIGASTMPEPFATILTIAQDEAIVHYLDFLRQSNNEMLSTLIDKIMGKVFARTETSQGYEIALDSKAVRTLNDDLNTLPVQQLIDKYFGEKTFDNTVDLIQELLITKKASEAIARIFELTKEYHIDREELFNLVEAMMMKYMGQELDLDAMIADERLSTYSFAEILEQQAEMEPGTIADSIKNTVEALRQVTAYRLIMGSAPADVQEMIHEIVDKVFADDALSLTFRTDKEGKVNSLGVMVKSFSFMMEDEDSSRYEFSGGFTVTWNDGEDVVYDPQYDVVDGVFDWVREQCKKENGTYTYSNTEKSGEGSGSRTVSFSYQWTLTGDVLSLKYEAKDTSVYDEQTVPGEGRWERGNETVYTYELQNVDAAQIQFSADCKDWVAYRISAPGVELTTEWYNFYRQYDAAGQLIDEQLEQSYGYTSSGTQMYWNTQTHAFSMQSHHKSVVDAEHSTTADQVKCNEAYYTYYKCENCGEFMYRSENRKSHEIQESVKLLSGSKTCTDGVEYTRKCKNCDYEYVTTQYNHVSAHNFDEYELQHGTLRIETWGCACGENSSMNINSEGCYFGYSSETSLGNGHTLATYRCAYEDCTSYYTKEYWRETKGCDIYERYVYKFYSDEGTLLGNKEYRSVDHYEHHLVGDPEETERQEFTMDKNGYTGYRIVESYEGCEHTGPYTVTREKHYDKYGRMIYDYQYNTYSMNGAAWTEYDYVEGGCECRITNHYSDGRVSSYTDTLHMLSGQFYEQTCTQFGYHVDICAVCGKEEYYFDSISYPLGHEFHGGKCIRCGLEAEQQASGNIVLEDMTKYEDYAAPYTVGVWSQNGALNVDLQLFLVYLNDQGEEETVEFGGEFKLGYRADPSLFENYVPACYIYTVDRNAVRNAIDGSKEFVGLRLTFIPVGSGDPQVTSITLVDETQAHAAAIGYHAEPICLPVDKRLYM